MVASALALPRRGLWLPERAGLVRGLDLSRLPEGLRQAAMALVGTRRALLSRRPVAATGGGGGITTYATWNPADKHADVALSGGNLVATSAGTNGSIYAGVRSNIGKSSGKWFWEDTFTSGLYMVSGAGESTQSLSPDTSFVGVSGDRVYHPNAHKYASGGAYGATLAAGDVVGWALDMDAGTLVAYKNGVSQGTLVSGLTGTFYAYLLMYDGSVTVTTTNFGASAFVYTPPAGFNAGLGN